jgi:hypothetical protein
LNGVMSFAFGCLFFFSFFFSWLLWERVGMPDEHWNKKKETRVETIVHVCHVSTRSVCSKSGGTNYHHCRHGETSGSRRSVAFRCNEYRTYLNFFLHFDFPSIDKQEGRLTKKMTSKTHWHLNRICLLDCNKVDVDVRYAKNSALRICWTMVRFFVLSWSWTIV